MKAHALYQQVEELVVLWNQRVEVGQVHQMEALVVQEVEEDHLHDLPGEVEVGVHQTNVEVVEVALQKKEVEVEVVLYE